MTSDGMRCANEVGMLGCDKQLEIVGMGAIRMLVSGGWSVCTFDLVTTRDMSSPFLEDRLESHIRGSIALISGG